MIGVFLPFVVMGCRWNVGDVYKVGCFSCGIVAYNVSYGYEKYLFVVVRVLITLGARETRFRETFSNDSSGRLMKTVLAVLSTRRTGKEPSAIGASL